jgi:hypothetical protein
LGGREVYRVLGDRMKIKKKIQKAILFLKTDTGRQWVKKAILFIIILLGLRWAIATGIKDGTKAGLWNIERSLDGINEELSELHRTLIITSATDGEHKKEMMIQRLIEFPPVSGRLKR